MSSERSQSLLAYIQSSEAGLCRVREKGILDGPSWSLLGVTLDHVLDVKLALNIQYRTMR